MDTNISVNKIVGILAILVIALFSSISSFYINDEYERSIVTRLGETHKTTGPGLHFKIPFMDSVHTVNIKIQQIDYTDVPTVTLDGQTIMIDMTINHRIQPDSDSNLIALYEQFGSE